MNVRKGRKFLNSLKLLYSSKFIGVKYSKTEKTSKNWGDALNEYLIPKLSGKTIIHYAEYFNSGIVPTLAAIGSILDNNRVRNLSVWGSGLKSGNAAIPVLPKRVFAVRGRLTQERLKKLQVSSPDIFGDPAIILPHYYQPSKATKKFKIGIVPHYVDKGSDKLTPLLNDPEVSFIDIESGIENFIDRITECEIIASSSLHGLIAADAYHIPRVWLTLSDKISGGDFKFLDYFSTTDYETPVAQSLEESLDTWVKRAVQPQRIADAEKLIDSFPVS